MKKSTIIAAAACIMMSGCGTMGVGTGTSTDILSGVLGAITNGETIGNVITSVIGLDKVSQQDLIGTWSYSGPGCAFTSQNALAKAGGEVAATQIKEKLKTQYNQFGFSAANTQITFAENGTFTAKIAGKSWSGKYTYNAETSQIAMSGLLLNVNAYAKRNSTGIGILFEASKLLTIMQTMAAISGNTSLETIGEISKNYDGVRIGFDMRK